MSNERRQYRRIPMGATVSFQELTFEKASVPAESIYGDLSAGGILLASPKGHPLGTLLKLELRVPGWGKHLNRFGPVHENEVRPLVAVGQVVRVEQMEDGSYELGIKFLNVYPDDLAALRNFIDASAAAEEN